jgi:hypothetical protein
MADEPDVWQHLLTADYVDEAEIIVVAAIGAGADPNVLITELARQAEKLVELQDDAQAIADRWVRLLAAVSAISLQAISFVAVNVAQVQDGLEEDAEPDAEKVRAAAVQILANVTASVREGLG